MIISTTPTKLFTLVWFFLKKIHKSDVFVFHDIAQFEKKRFFK